MLLSDVSEWHAWFMRDYGAANIEREDIQAYMGGNYVVESGSYKFTNSTGQEVDHGW